MGGGDLGTLFRSSFRKIIEGNPTLITLNTEEEATLKALCRDNGQTHCWTLLEEWSLKGVDLSNVYEKGTSYPSSFFFKLFDNSY